MERSWGEFSHWVSLFISRWSPCFPIHPHGLVFSDAASSPSATRGREVPRLPIPHRSRSPAPRRRVHPPSDHRWCPLTILSHGHWRSHSLLLLSLGVPHKFHGIFERYTTTPNVLDSLGDGSPPTSVGRRSMSRMNELVAGWSS